MQATTLFESASLSVYDYRCTRGPGDRPFAEMHQRHSVSYVRSGSFGCRTLGRAWDFVAGAVMVGRPGQEYMATHEHHACGDECLSVKLSAELVVLSACRTGLGKDAPGEGLLSLTRGFLSSGAARVIVTLWSIEDQASAEMMSQFYRRALGPQRMTPAAALRATQEEMWREGRWSAPYYWGGFVLQGNWR